MNEFEKFFQSDDHEETFERGDLSGIVVDVNGDMVRVRFLDSSDHAGKTMSCRMVIRADGSLGIDPSGLPVKRPPSQLALDEEVPVEGSAEEDMNPVLSVPPPALSIADAQKAPDRGLVIEVQVGADDRIIYVGRVMETDPDYVTIRFDTGAARAYGWMWLPRDYPRIRCEKLEFSRNGEFA